MTNPLAGSRCDGAVSVFVTLSGIMSSLSLLRGLRGLKGPSDDGTDDGHQFTVSQGRKYVPLVMQIYLNKYVTNHHISKIEIEHK